MKASFHIFLLVILFLLNRGLFVNAYAQGVEFQHLTLSEAIETAKQSDKLVLVDVFTDWCPPCKQMDRNILTQPDVGEVYNQHFVCIKIDAEKGSGPALAKQYEVTAFPTYLYLDSKGNLVHRAVGYFKENDFLQQAFDALDASRDSWISVLDSTFESGDRGREFLREYIIKMKEVGLNNSKIVDAYFSQLSHDDLKNTDELTFLSQMVNAADNNAFAYLLENFDRLEESVGGDVASDFFSILLEAASDAYEIEQPLIVNKMLSAAELLLPSVDPKKHQALYRLQLAHYRRVRSTSGVKRSGQALVQGIMELRDTDITLENSSRYDTLMEPYWSGEQDSTKIEDFQQQKDFARILYTREICSYLYEAALAYANALPNNDPALRLAEKWITRCDELMPRTLQFEELKGDLASRLNLVEN